VQIVWSTASKFANLLANDIYILCPLEQVTFSSGPRRDDTLAKTGSVLQRCHVIRIMYEKNDVQLLDFNALFLFQRKEYVKYAKVFPLSGTLDFKVPSKWYRRVVGSLEIICGLAMAIIPSRRCKESITIFHRTTNETPFYAFQQPHFREL